jgi:LEA14-like dessication related protein
MLRRLLPFAALGALAAGCGGVQHAPTTGLAPIALKMESLQAEGADALGVTLRLVGQLENQNPVGLSVERFAYAVEVEGKRIGKGKVRSGLAVPASGTAPVSIPVRLEWTKVPKLPAVLATRGALPVRVSGTAVVSAGGGELALPYALDGSLLLPRLPAIALEGAVTRETGVLQNTIELRVAVQNPNPFALPVGSLTYDLWLSGVSVAKAVSTSLDAVPPGGSITVIIPLHLSSISAAIGAFSGKVSGRPSVQLIGRVGYGALEVALDTRSTLER